MICVLNATFTGYFGCLCEMHRPISIYFCSCRKGEFVSAQQENILNLLVCNKHVLDWNKGHIESLFSTISVLIVMVTGFLCETQWSIGSYFWRCRQAKLENAQHYVVGKGNVKNATMQMISLI